MYKLKNIKLTNLIGGISMCVLLTLALLIISPPTADSASADSRTVDSASFGVNINSGSVVSIAIDKKQEEANVTPTTTGSFTSQDAIVTVQTNNLDGYKLMLTTSNGQNDQPELVNVNHTDSVITSTTSTLSGDSLAKNTWGYNLTAGTIASTASTEYHQIVNGSVIATTEKIAEVKPEVYTLSFGAKVSSDIPAGKYSAIATISAVANPIAIDNLQNLTYMQDMTHEICAKTPGRDGATTVTPGNEITKQLVDTRDGNIYWVAKLADQNCWMTQNLALNLDATKGLSVTNSDLTEDWTSKSAYPLKSTITNFNFAPEGSAATTSTYSWNIGNYVLRGSDDNTQCANITNNNDIANCVRLEEYTGTQDTHYLIGNYYQWNTATAGSGGGITSTGTEGSIVPNSATQSICPKNWRLPTADGGAEEIMHSTRFTQTYFDKYGNTTFSNLFNAYGYSFPEGGPPNYYGSNIQNNYNSTSAPFYIVRSGIINPEDNALAVVGGEGDLWSGTAATNSSLVYRLYSNIAALYPTSSYYNQKAFPIRCLAR